MFDSLKKKLKDVFKKTSPKLEETIYEEPQAPVEKDQTPPTEESAPVEPAPAVEPARPSSRKEQIKLAKEERTKKSAVGDSGKKIKNEALDEVLDELEIVLLEADVAFPVVQEVLKGVRENLTGKKYSREFSVEEVIEQSVKDAVRDVLKLNEFDFDSWVESQERPTVIMFVGINGTGKTTAIAKLANRLQKNGHTVVMAGCDTFRAGAIEQLTIHADKLGCKIVKHSQDADPAAVAYDAVEHARAKKKEIVLVDTAGRMQTNNNLIEEMKKIVRVAKPSLKVFVGDSLAGNDAVEQARVFDAAIGVDAVILTKIDTDAKGGAALSIAHTIGKPIAFVCNGQEYDDIVKFDADWMLGRLFDE